jgi:hypothetical protein
MFNHVGGKPPFFDGISSFAHWKSKAKGQAQHHSLVPSLDTPGSRTPTGCDTIYFWWTLDPVKALVWFWLIDKTLVLTSMLSVCSSR